jgi:DNA-binding IclR family transcriptional regulator
MKEKSEKRPVERRQRVQSAAMGMGILKALSRLGGAASLTAVSAEVGESTAKVHRYLASLCEEGLVAQDPSTQHYYLGREAIQIGLAALRQCDPVRLGAPALIRLREELQATCFIAIMGNKGPTILRIEEPALPVTINVRAGSVMPILWSATGRVFLTFMDDVDIRSEANEELAQATKEQRASLDARNPIEHLRKKIIAKGCATVDGILLGGISAVAAPIFDHTGHVVAVLTALGASGGFDSSPGGKIVNQVIHEAQSISAALGFSDRPEGLQGGATPG